MTVPERQFSHIHVNLMGRLPALEVTTYMFTVIDRN
jgi:hypothetical protein